MSIHPLVIQLRFTRSEFARCFKGVRPDEGLRRFESINSLGWMLGHMANQEHRWWVQIAQGHVLYPDLNDLVGFEKPASTPPLDEMWSAWYEITRAADTFLDTLTQGRLLEHLVHEGKSQPESIGTRLQRNIYHYWFHTGEAYAVRQLLGHRDLPVFVGDMSEAPYKPDRSTPIGD